MVNIAILTSGNGHNVDNIYRYIKSRNLDDINRHDSMNVKIVVSRNDNAYVINRCNRLGISCVVTKDVGDVLRLNDIGFVVLLDNFKISDDIRNYYTDKILVSSQISSTMEDVDINDINNYKYMIKNKDKYVGVLFKCGDKIIYQVNYKIMDTDTPEILLNKVHSLERKWFPVILYSLICKL